LSLFVPPHQKVIAVSPASASKRTMIDGMIEISVTKLIERFRNDHGNLYMAGLIEG
jgi:hypothetical protein